MKLLTQNTKIRKTGKKHGVNLWNWTIPAFQDPETGKRTCPFAGSCAKICYARGGFYRMSNVKSAHAERYYASKSDFFEQNMYDDIKKRKAEIIRIHDAGDYYSPKYIKKWFNIMQALPDVYFYSYTKSHTLFDDLTLPDNFHMTKSIGGTKDHLIDKENDYFSDIFPTHESILDAGFVDASFDDLLSTPRFNPDNNKIGLLKH